MNLTIEILISGSDGGCFMRQEFGSPIMPQVGMWLKYGTDEPLIVESITVVAGEPEILVGVKALLLKGPCGDAIKVLERKGWHVR